MNEKWHVLTYRNYDFVDANTGERKIGRSLHCYRSCKERGWPGVEYAKFTCPEDSDAYSAEIHLGKVYEIGFNRFGKAISIIPAE